MDDACYCDYDDPPAFYHKETRKARKPHKCTECGRAIMPGERYEHIRAKWDSIPDVVRTCPRCLDLKRWVEAHVPCVCWYHHAIRDNAAEAIHEYMHECPGLWFGWGRKEVAIRRQPRFSNLAREVAR